MAYLHEHWRPLPAKQHTLSDISQIDWTSLAGTTNRCEKWGPLVLIEKDQIRFAIFLKTSPAGHVSYIDLKKRDSYILT